jgi:hypothetical protein
VVSIPARNQNSANAKTPCSKILDIQARLAGAAIASRMGASLQCKAFISCSNAQCNVC